MAGDVSHILERLRSGVVPGRGLELFAVGIDSARAELGRQIDRAQDGDGAFKFLRGGYGCGKTFMSRLIALDAQKRNFATSFVVVSDNDLEFHKFDDVYRKVMAELSTQWCEKGALGDILDRMIATVEDALIAAGANEDAPDFDDVVLRELESRLKTATGGKAPDDLYRVVRTIFGLKQQGRLTDAGALVSWLSGSTNVAAGAKKLAGVRGDIGSKEAMDYLRGILEIIKAAGHPGWVIVIDEVETILRSRRDVRGRSLNGIRQILDASDRFPGLLWVFTGTPEFFDTPRGVAGLPPLHDRIRFNDSGAYTSLRQPQLALKPFDRERLRKVAWKLRELFPAEDRARMESRVPPELIDRLVDRVTAGFRGDVGVVPRQFLRTFVELLDRVDEHPDYDPARDEAFGTPEAARLSDDERRLAEGRPPFTAEPEDGRGYEVVEF